LTSAINSGEAVLFIDDLDLLTYKDTNRFANFLSALRNTMPGLQLVVTAAPSCLGYLAKAPLEHISIAPWNNSSKVSYLAKLGANWRSPHEPESEDKTDQINIQNSMLVVSDEFSTPLEFTLKAWSVFAGDIGGPSSVHAIEAFLKRCFPANTSKSLGLLETIALYSLDQELSSFSQKDIRGWLSDIKSSGDIEVLDDKLGELTPVLQSARTHGILNKDGSDKYYLSSATIGGYLAARGLRRLNPKRISTILDQPGWALKHETMRYLSAFNDIEPFLQTVTSDQSLMKDKLVQACNWLAYTKHNSPPEISLLKAVTREILTNQAYLVKLRLVAALAKSGNPNARSIFQRLFSANDLDTRRAVALGSGLLRDITAVPQLITQLNDTIPASTAACYALGRIASPKSLEAIAEKLLHGKELLRRSAAESLAQNRSEGHPALREGASMDDLLVRYAVVHGLSMIDEDWALDILDKMRIDEGQWIVRDLAQQVYENHQNSSPYIPTNRPSPASAAWLHAFASRQELPEPRPETALEMLLKALTAGSDEQKQASLEYLSYLGGIEIIPELQKLFRYHNPEVRQQAMLTAWYCSPPNYVIPG